MSNLANLKCSPCKKGTPPLKGEALTSYVQRLGGSASGQHWMVKEEHHLEKEFTFKNFKEALSFTNKVGELAESEGHHPDIYLAWGNVKITLWTHNINGLSESDFILAAKISEIS